MALRQTSSPVPVISKKQFEKEEKKLIKEIQLTTEETNELRDRLIYVTEGSMNKRPYHRQNPLYEKLKLKEKEIMTFLHNLEMETMEARENNQELKEINFYQSQKLQESWDWPQQKRASCRMSCHTRRPLLNTIPSIHNLPWMNLLLYNSFS